MDSPPDAAVIALLDKLWEELWVRLLATAYTICRSRQHAGDLVVEAYLRIRTGTRKWNPVIHTDLVFYAAGVMRSLWSIQQQSAASRREKGPADERLPALTTPTPEELYVTEEERPMYEILRKALADDFGEQDTLAHRFLALGQNGIFAEADQAEALGITMREIKSLRKRVRDTVARVVTKQQERMSP